MPDLAAIQAEMKRRGMSAPAADVDKAAVGAELTRRGISPPAPGKNGTQPIVENKNYLLNQGINPGRVGEEMRTDLVKGQTNTQAADMTAGLPPNMDWMSGVDFGSMRDFLAADNDKERAKVLEAGKTAGKWNSWGQAGGTWFITKGGKPVAVMGTDGLKAFAASVAAHPIESAAMAGSALLPEFRAAGAIKSGAEVTIGYALKRGMTGAVYNAGRASIVAAATAAGYAADEATKWFRGLWDKSSDEEKHQLGVAALTGFLPELFLRTAGSIVRTVGSGYAPFLTKEQRAQTMDALKRGMVPRIAQATHGAAKFLPFEQSMSEYVFGFPAKDRNSAAVQKIILEQAKKAGMTDAEAQASLHNIMQSATASIDQTAVNDSLRAGAAQRITTQQGNVEAQRNMLQGTLDQNLKTIEQGIGSSDPRIQDQVRQGMIQARQQFSQQVGRIYDQVADIIAQDERPVAIDTSDIKRVADEVWHDLPRDQDNKVIFDRNPALGGTMIKIKNLPQFIDFKTAQRIRSELFNGGAYGDLTPSRNDVLMNRVAQAVDKAFDQPGLSAGNAVAAAKLREADAAWKAGIGKFKGILVRQLVKDAESGRIADPRTIANMIFNKQYTGEALRIKGMMPEETWRKVGAGYWEELKSQATDPATGALDPKKFLKTVNDQRGNLETAFGKEKAKAIREFANRNAVMNGKLDAKMLTADNFFHSLTKYEGDKAALDKRLQSEFVQMLTGPQAERINAVDYMMESAKRILEAKGFYGEGSHEWQTVKNTVMTRLLSHAISPDESLMKTVFRPGGLSGALAKYSEKDLAAIFGPEHAGDLRQLAKTIDFMTAKPVGKMTGVFAAAQLVLHPFGHIPAIAQLVLQGELFAQPWFVKWLTQGFEEGTLRNIDRAATLAKMMAYSTFPGLAQMGPGVGINKVHQQQDIQVEAGQ